MTMLDQLKKDLHALGNPEKATSLQRFFKTGKGDYAEHDQFIGVTVPNSRSIAKRFKDLPFEDIKKLLTSPIHEERLVALFIMVLQYAKASAETQKEIYTFYLAHTQHINNWDLVDSSADKIVGVYLMDKPKDILYTLARSPLLWERRIAVLATFYYIKHEQYEDALQIAEILLTDTHDLIHRAVGWMLREIGERSHETEVAFLKEHYKQMPRTMLRYAIEKFDEDTRKKYLQGLI